jgi:hypothetical protein
MTVVQRRRAILKRVMDLYGTSRRLQAEPSVVYHSLALWLAPVPLNSGLVPSPA